MRSRRMVWAAASAALAIFAIISALLFFVRREHEQRELAVPRPKPEAPPDLEKLRNAYTAGVDAIRHNDGPAAVQQLSSFSFRKRAVEEYRLYYLANGQQLAGDRAAARGTLARLWSSHPKLTLWVDVGLNLANLYGSVADWQHAGDIFSAVADRSGDSTVAGSARWSTLESRFARGDIAGVLYNARAIAIRNPRCKQANNAIDVVRTLTSLAPSDLIRLTPRERLERGVSLLRDGDPESAANELTALATSGVPSDIRLAVELNRGLALSQVRQYENANKVLEPLTSGPYRIAIPAVYTLSKNYRVLSASINPTVNKTITVKQKVGTVKVRVKGKKKLVTRPKYANVHKTIQLVDLAKKAKKESYDRLSIERLKDLVLLPLADEVRIEVLNTLIGIAESKNQDAYEQDLIRQLSKLDPGQEAGLQHFWDKAWAAYARGDLNGARELLVFIRDTYTNANLKRQAIYWFARSSERLGRKDEATALYQQLANAPYDDIYAIESEKRGARRQAPRGNPLNDGPDWREIAEKSVPQELRLAYELTALSDTRDAMLELTANRKRTNQRFADALLAELYGSNGDIPNMMLTLRRAFPQLATVEQDTVPPYFLKMYYPLRYQPVIVRYANRNGLDPYLVMGLIHQESYFNPRAHSYVGATGLMQLMPSTGRELAGRLGISPRLEDPNTNIRLGTAHFKMLVDLFGGNTDLAIAAYNAGQGRVMQWRRGAPGKPIDEFIEAIPFRETRTYVKHVVMLASTYRRFYPM